MIEEVYVGTVSGVDEPQTAVEGLSREPRARTHPGAADDDPSVRDGPTSRRVQLTTNPPDLYR